MTLAEIFQQIMRLFTYIFILLTFASCVQTRNLSKVSSETGLSFILNLPVVELDGRLNNVRDSTPIYYHNNLILYQLQYFFDSTHSVYNDTTKAFDIKFAMEEIRYKYFIYTKGSKYGILYNSLKGSVFKETLTDSVLSHNKSPDNIHSIISDTNYTLTQKYNGPDKKFYYESYAYKNKKNSLEVDSINFYYSNSLMNFSLSLSPILDSIFHSKLTQFKIIYNEGYNSEYCITMPYREYYCKIEKLDIVPKEINLLFTKYEIDKKKIR